MSGIKDAINSKKKAMLSRFKSRQQQLRQSRRERKLPRLEQLCVEGRWDDVREHLLQSAETTVAKKKGSTKNLANSGGAAETPLHTVCRYHPPLEIVKFLLLELPSTTASLLAAQMNHEGQTPLHVAAQCGASSKVVHYLAQQCRQASEAQDEEGNTPLHLHLLHTSGVKVCDADIKVLSKGVSDRTLSSSVYSYCSDFNGAKHHQQQHQQQTAALTGPAASAGNSSTKNPVRSVVLVEGPNLEIIQTLMKAASSPEMLLMESNDELSVIELAIMSELDYKLVSKMQEITRKYRTEQRKKKINSSGGQASTPAERRCFVTTSSAA